MAAAKSRQPGAHDSDTRLMPCRKPSRRGKGLCRGSQRKTCARCRGTGEKFPARQGPVRDHSRLELLEHSIHGKVALRCRCMDREEPAQSCGQRCPGRPASTHWTLVPVAHVHPPAPRRSPRAAQDSQVAVPPERPSDAGLPCSRSATSGNHTSRRRRLQTVRPTMSTTQHAAQTRYPTDGGDCTKNGFPARSVVAPSTSR